MLPKLRSRHIADGRVERRIKPFQHARGADRTRAGNDHAAAPSVRRARTRPPASAFPASTPTNPSGALPCRARGQNPLPAPGRWPAPRASSISMPARLLVTQRGRITMRPVMTALRERRAMPADVRRRDEARFMRPAFGDAALFQRLLQPRRRKIAEPRVQHQASAARDHMDACRSAACACARSSRRHPRAGAPAHRLQQTLRRQLQPLGSEQAQHARIVPA